MPNTIILGAGFSGLATAITSGGTVYEATDSPGGLGASYEINGFRFERGGGHWLFGGDPMVTAFIQGLCDIKRYERKSSIYFPDEDKFYPYPIQSTPEFASVISQETGGEYGQPIVTIKDDLRHRFGTTMCEKFFFPFNDLYTAGLYDKVAPQDAYKSPPIGNKGYNETFIYPVQGLGHLARRMAARCEVRFNKRAKWIDTREKMVHFEDDTCQGYGKLVSTLPLNRMMVMTGLQPDNDASDPAVSVAVYNIAAKRGKNCPSDQWVYTPNSDAGFHRVGFYSNVDKILAPFGKQDTHVSMYVESAHKYDPHASNGLVSEWSNESAVIWTLQEWGWIEDTEVVDRTDVEIAYTYCRPESTWREDAIALLKQHDITCVGRFAEWRFCGIVESMRRGFEAGVNL